MKIALISTLHREESEKRKSVFRDALNRFRDVDLIAFPGHTLDEKEFEDVRARLKRVGVDGVM